MNTRTCQACESCLNLALQTPSLRSCIEANTPPTCSSNMSATNVHSSKLAAWLQLGNCLPIGPGLHHPALPSPVAFSVCLAWPALPCLCHSSPPPWCRPCPCPCRCPCACCCPVSLCPYLCCLHGVCLGLHHLLGFLALTHQQVNLEGGRDAPDVTHCTHTQSQMRTLSQSHIPHTYHKMWGRYTGMRMYKKRMNCGDKRSLPLCPRTLPVYSLTDWMT